MDNSGAGEPVAVAKEFEEKAEEKFEHDSEDVGPKSKGDIGAAHVPSSQSSSSGDDQLRRLDSKIVKVRDTPEGDAAFAHLPDDERDIVKSQLDIPPVKVSFTTLFRYSSRNDLIFLFISAFCACAGGAVMPLMTVSIYTLLRNTVLTLENS
jgi:ATP-binding cassette, subfamily B (MDR/TAP), member 1